MMWAKDYWGRKWCCSFLCMIKFVKKVFFTNLYGIKLYFCSCMHNHYKVYANACAKPQVFFLSYWYITYPYLLTMIIKLTEVRFDGGWRLGRTGSFPAKKIIADTFACWFNQKYIRQFDWFWWDIRVDTTLFSKDSLDAPIHYTADEKLVSYHSTSGTVHVVGVDYNDIKLDADTINYDQRNGPCFLMGGTDTSKALWIAHCMPVRHLQWFTVLQILNLKGITKNTQYKEDELL